MLHTVSESLLPDGPNLKVIHLMYRNVDVMKCPMGHSETSLNLVGQDFGDKSIHENLLSSLEKDPKVGRLPTVKRM